MAEELSKNIADLSLSTRNANAPVGSDPSGSEPKHYPKDDSSINYGAAARNLEGHGSKPFYISTAIAYTNGFPHIGHAYEFITTDVLARYHRVLGFDTFFLTGSDEHGQKVAASAEKSGKRPIDHCDFYVNSFKALNQALAISNDDYIRTTEPRHEELAQRLWTQCAESGDIYLDSYEGWYNEREELFVTEMEAEASNYCDPGSGLPLKKVKEESYFFRMSKYCDRLIEHIESNPSFIEPEQFRNNILARLKKEGLKDLSVSRTSFDWGIPVPPGFDPKHVMYVWFDALSNYVTGVHGLDPSHPRSKYWPASRHIIGKDIIWFHCVIWPCILMSAGVPLPFGVYSHGFVNASDGRKMSKSYGNTVDTHDILSKYPVDSLRYYMTSSLTYGMDLNFSEPALLTMHNSELADILGNLIHRAFNLCVKYCGGVVPDVSHDPAFPMPFDLEALGRDVEGAMSQCLINNAIFKSMEAVRATNRFLTEAEPWKMKGADEIRRPSIVRTTLEAVYAFSHFLAPVIPLSAQLIFDKLHTPPRAFPTLRSDFYNLVPGTPVDVGDILFQKIDPELLLPSPSPEATTATEGKPVVVGKNKGKSSSPAPPAPPAAVEDPNQSDFSKMDLRVGRILRVWPHETAERLFCEEIDIGGEIRTVASGIRQYYTVEQLTNRLVVVVCNLKETKLQGFLSTAMVLAAKRTPQEGEEGSSSLELLEPHADSIVGERIVVEGMFGEPFTPARVKKLKIWEAVVPDLRTNENREASWKGQTIRSSTGACTVPSLSDAPIA